MAALGGYFSLNYTPASVLTITTLLGLEEGEKVLWVGAGDGREALSVALLHPGCRIVAIERNEALVNIAQRVQESLSVPNIRFEHADAMHLPSTEGFTHVFSTALSGDRFYEMLCRMLRPAQRAILLTEMWRGKRQTIAEETATIMLSGSGGRRQLRAATIKGPARAGRAGTDPVAAAVLATTPPSAHGRGVKRRVREGEEEVEVEAVEYDEGDEGDSRSALTEAQCDELLQAVKAMLKAATAHHEVLHGWTITYKPRKPGSAGPKGDMCARKGGEKVFSQPALERKLRGTV